MLLSLALSVGIDLVCETTNYGDYFKYIKYYSYIIQLVEWWQPQSESRN